MKFSSVLILCMVACVLGQGQVAKNGDCPPPTPVGICVETCFSDFECAGIAKCCSTACGGSVCTRPVTMRQGRVSQVKPGNCPAPSGPWVCTSTCGVDTDCRGRLKCCKNRCGAFACSKPVQ